MKKFIFEHRIPLILFAVCLVTAGVSWYYLSIFNTCKDVACHVSTPVIPTSTDNNVNVDSPSTINNNYQTGKDAINRVSTTTSSTITTSPVIPHPDETNTYIPEPQIFTDFTVLKVNGKERTVPITTSTTVYEMMSYYQMISSDSDFQFETKDYSAMGKFVTKIGGVTNNENNSGKFWIYYINGQSAKVGISNYILKPNDLIEWKYETSSM